MAKYLKSASSIERKSLFVQGLKRCNICDQIKALSNFGTSNTKAGVTPYCKPCMVEYKYEWHKQRRIEIREFVYEHLKNNPCVDCGDADVLNLDFDHIRNGIKRFNIAHAFMLRGMSIKKLKSEIAKCDVRCSKCHKIRTHEVSNSWKYLMALERGDV